MNVAAAPSDPITVDAPAKINLTLHVCGQRADGYHLLESLVVFADIGDQITATAADELVMEITGPFGNTLADEPDNLVLRAARLLRDFTGRKDGAHILLEKNLPAASGIGGGSSDAAATLRACGELWATDPFQIPGTRLAAELGADVPVCFYRRPAFMSGIGETLDPAPQLPTVWLVLVNSGHPLATKDVFAALQGFSNPMARSVFKNLTDAAGLAAVLRDHQNTLTVPATKLAPSIASTLAALENSPDCLLARLSGSGPTCFGVFAGEHAARTSAALIASREPEWWVVPARVLPEGEP